MLSPALAASLWKQFLIHHHQPVYQFSAQDVEEADYTTRIKI